MKRILLTVAFVLMIGNVSLAQSPESFKYQAVVRSSDNTVLANAPVGVQFRIVQGSVAGIHIYTETFELTTNDYGLINVSIGTGTTTDNFESINWATGPYFIETSIDTEGGTSYDVIGTSQLLSVPYALYAKDAGNVFSGNYNDLTDAPDIPENTSDLVNDSGFITDPNDADSDPTNELQSWSDLPGIPVDIADGDDVNDADSDPTNELQSWSDLPGIPADIADGDAVDDADSDPTNELQDWLTLPGIPADIKDGDDVNDADSDPTNELQSWSDLPGIPADIADGDAVNDADSDPTNEIQIIVSGDAGNAISSGSDGGAFIVLGTGGVDLDADPSNELQDWSTLPGIPADIADGDAVDDADSDPTNELQTWSTLPGIPADIADGDAVDDADSDPTNEIQIIVSTAAGNILTVGADGGAYLAATGGTDADWTVSGVDQFSAVTGNVGVGTTTPDEKLDVNGKIVVTQSPGDEMVIVNDDIWQHGNGNQDYGDGGDHFIIASREGSFESAGVYGDGDHLTLWSPGDAAPGQPAALIYVTDEDGYDGDNNPFNGTALDAYLNTAGNWVSASDRNRKENIAQLNGNSTLKKLTKLNGYTYNFKLSPEEAKKGSQVETTYGVIAQEVYNVFPEIVDIADDGSHYVCYTEFVPILIESVKEQQETIKTVEEENATLRAENEALKAQMDAFERRLRALEEK